MVVTSSAAQLRREAEQAARIAEDLARQATEAALAEREASRPKMPPVDVDGKTTVITFVRYQSGREYQYAAIGWRTGRSVRWAVTGSETRRFNWPGLLDFIGEANWHSIAEVTETRRILPRSAEPPVAETMGRYGRVLGVDTVTPYVDR